MSNYAKQKEVRSVMELIKNELQYNRDQVAAIRKPMQAEMQMYEWLVKNHFQYGKLPKDTLNKYYNAFNTMWRLYCTDQALQVLQTSALMQHIPNKEFLVTLIRNYQEGQRLQERIEFYLDRKKEVMTTFLKELSADDLDKLNSPNIEDKYHVILSSKALRTHIATNAGFFNALSFDQNDEIWLQTIELIDKHYQ